MELGIRSTEANGPQPFSAPYENWTWEAFITGSETETGESSGLSRVEVVIRHKTSPIVRRLAQVIHLDRAAKPRPRSPGA
jgi:hypothetical protein